MNEKEKVLVQWTKALQRQRMSPNYDTIRLILRDLLRKKGDSKPLNKHFVTRIVQRHLELKSGYSRTMNAKRVSALNIDIINILRSLKSFKRLIRSIRRISIIWMRQACKWVIYSLNSWCTTPHRALLWSLLQRIRTGCQLLSVSPCENSTKTDWPRLPLLVGLHAALCQPTQGPAQLRLSLDQAAPGFLMSLVTHSCPTNMDSESVPLRL
jgi:hypothetical protein